MLGALISLAVAFATFAAAWSAYAERQHADELSRQVSALAAGLAAADPVPSPEATAAQERLLKVEAGLLGAVLFETDVVGAVQRATTADAPESLPLGQLRARDANGSASGVLRTAQGVRVLVVAAPIDASRRLVAVQSLSEVRSAAAGIIAIGGLAALLAAAVAYFAGGVLARRLTAPLVRLESAAESVAAGAWGTQVAEEGDLETASLARSFNRMSTRVADAYAAEKAFVGDVSHEIRTPLTSIRGFAEAMLDGTVTDPAQQRRALTVIRDEAVRVGEVSETLLALAELDAGAVEVAHAPVDLVALAEALRGRFAAPARDAGLELEIDLAGGGTPLGDPDRLLQAASTLVANALSYTPSGGRVLVSSALDREGWHLRVEDSGPGIPAEKRDAVFGRFARLDESRASDSGGAGLGLAICARLVELMGGRVSVGESAELGGALLDIALDPYTGTPPIA